MVNLGIAVAILGAAWFFGSMARAGEPLDSLLLINGVRLEGHSGTLLDGHLEWQMPHGGELLVPLPEIERIDYRLLDMSSIAGDASDSAAAGAEMTAGVIGAGSVVDPLISDDPGRHVWYSPYETFNSGSCYVIDRTKRIAVGGRFMQGNTEQDVIDLSAVLESNEGNFTKQLTLTGEYGRSTNITVANEWTANATIDYSKEKKWIVYFKSLNEYDQFENLDYRGTVSGGMGYRWHNTKTHRLIARVGPAVTHELFKNPQDSRITADVLGEVESIWPLFDHTKLEHKSTLRPSVDDVSVFRLLSNSGILFPLDEKEQWMIKLGVKLEYNSRPNEGRLKADYTTNVSLVYTPK